MNFFNSILPKSDFGMCVVGLYGLLTVSGLAITVAETVAGAAAESL